MDLLFVLGYDLDASSWLEAKAIAGGEHPWDSLSFLGDPKYRDGRLRNRLIQRGRCQQAFLDLGAWHGVPMGTGLRRPQPLIEVVGKTLRDLGLEPLGLRVCQVPGVTQQSNEKMLQEVVVSKNLDSRRSPRFCEDYILVAFLTHKSEPFEATDRLRYGGAGHSQPPGELDVRHVSIVAADDVDAAEVLGSRGELFVNRDEVWLHVQNLIPAQPGGEWE